MGIGRDGSWATHKSFRVLQARGASAGLPLAHWDSYGCRHSDEGRWSNARCEWPRGLSAR